MARRGRWLSVSLFAVLSLGAAAGGGNARAAPIEPSCPADGTPVELESVVQVEQLLTGVWIRCDGPPLPGSPIEEVGLEVTADGSFHRLYDAGDGSLIRASGVEQEGTVAVWDLTDMNGPGSYQVDWQLLGGGTASSIVTFTPSPSTMRFEMGAIHVRTDEATIVDGVVPGTETGCGLLDDPVDIDPGGLATAIVGVWVRCSGQPLFGLDDVEVGIELMAGGEFHRLYRDGDGGLIRASGVLEEGEWSVTGDTQVDLRLLGGGTNYVHAVLFDAPVRSMRLIWMVGPTDLQLWDGAPPTAGSAPGADGCLLDDPITPASADEAVDLFVGVWIPCVGAGGPDGQVGIEIAADGRFYRVYRAADGSLFRADGFRQEGRWNLSGDGGAGRFDFSLYLVGSGWFGALPTFFESPASSVWLDPGTFFFPAGGYLRWTGDPPVLAAPPLPEPRCGHFREPVTLGSAEQANQLLVGAWTLCDLTSVLGAAVDGEVGIEFGADGRFHLLLRRSDGSVVAGSGPGREGTWTNAGITMPGIVQLDLAIEEGMTKWVNPLFFGDPDAVYFQQGGFGTNYVRGAPAVESLPVALPPTGGDAAVHLGLAALLIAVGLFAVVTSGRRRART